MTDKTDSKEREAFEAWRSDLPYQGATQLQKEAFIAGFRAAIEQGGSGAAIAEIGSAAGEDAEFGQRAIYPLVDIDRFEYCTKLYARASLAASAGREPVAPAGAAVLCWVNEDELPEGLTQEAYSALFPYSKVDVVRIFPIFGPTAQAAPAGAGAWAHLKLMMEESAWDGTLQLSDALANIDDFAAAYPSPPEGMVGGWMPIETAPKDGKLILVNFKIKGVRAVSWDSPFHDEVTAENGIWCVDDDKHGPYALRGYNDDGPTAPTHWMPLPPPPTTSAGSGKGE